MGGVHDTVQKIAGHHNSRRLPATMLQPRNNRHPSCGLGPRKTQEMRRLRRRWWRKNLKMNLKLGEVAEEGNKKEGEKEAQKLMKP